MSTTPSERSRARASLLSARLCVALRCRSATSVHGATRSSCAYCRSPCLVRCSVRPRSKHVRARAVLDHRRYSSPRLSQPEWRWSGSIFTACMQQKRSRSEGHLERYARYLCKIFLSFFRFISGTISRACSTHAHTNSRQ